jgi:hypothetical protein
MVKIEVGETYRHIKTTEVDMRVVAVYTEEPEYYKLLVEWINRFHPHIRHIDNVTLKTKDLPNWVQL